MSSPARPMTLLDKDDILAGLFASWDRIDALLSGLPEADWQTPTALPGWTVQDVVSHIIGTECMLLGVPTPEPDVDLGALEHVRNEIGVMNESWVRYLRAETPAQMLERFRDITGQRRTMLSNMIEPAWNAKTMTPAGPDTYGRFMRIRVFDCWIHEQDIRQAVDKPSTDAELSGPDTALALDEIDASMPFVVGKLGKAPDGARVTFELTGPLQRTVRVAVDGRAALVDDFDGAEATTTITLDGLQFTRLCGGRPMCPARPDAVDYAGDVEVGETIVTRLNYVI